MKTTPLTLMALAVLALAGCTPGPAPEETESGCSPENATFEWGDAAIGGKVLLGAQLLEYTDGATRSTLESRQGEAEGAFPDAALAELGVTEDRLEAWHEALIAQARDSGAVVAGFETSTAISDEPYVEITTPEDGRYVVSVMAPLTTVPVAIGCEGVDPVAGELVGVDTEAIEAVPLRCVPDLDDEPGASLEGKTTREYCAEG